MSVRYFCFLILSLLALSTRAQEKYVLSGTVRDSANGEDMIGATIFVQELNNGASTNTYGFFSISLPKGTYNVTVSYVGYDPLNKTIELNSNYKLDVALNEHRVETKEVIVTAERKDAQVKNLEMGVSKLEMKQISSIPPLLGEVDVIRSIQLLPGVSTVGEGASGFNVRGGGVDQNLILLDEAPVYNSSHLFGFFSVFNPDAVKDVKLSKSAIPAQYGGRLSSVLDVRMKEGNMKKLNVQGGLGLVFSRLTVEAPIKKDKASFIVAARRSYIDVLARPLLSGDFKKAKLYFYDLTLKTNYILNKNNRIFLSGYFGRDVFGATGATFSWGNSTASLRWNHLFSSKLFMNLTTYYSNYDYKLAFGEKGEDDSFEWTSRILNYSLKPDFTWFVNNKNTITFGAQAIYYTFKPSNGISVSKGKTSDISLPLKYGSENAVYLANEQKLSSRISISYGLRVSFFNYLGEGNAYSYAGTSGNYVREPVSVQKYKSGENIKGYINPEPRAAVNFSLSESSSMKASYNRMAQYIHLISNTTASIPLDVYTPSTNNLKPQLSDQYSLGYFKNLGKNGGIETSVEIFYKDMQNQLDYIDGASLNFNPNLEGEIIPGIGRAYGAEFYVKKNEGRFTGWISYTLSKSERRVAGINQDRWYPNKYDRRHNLSVVGIYELAKRWSVSGTFTLGSGTPFTFATDKFQIQGITVPYNPGDPRNNYRLPTYHRMDLSATWKSKEKEHNSKIFKNYSWEMVFAIYNVYNRRNAFAILPTQNPDNPGMSEAVRFSIFGSFIPALTYNFKF